MLARVSGTISGKISDRVLYFEDYDEDQTIRGRVVEKFNRPSRSETDDEGVRDDADHIQEPDDIEPSAYVLSAEANRTLEHEQEAKGVHSHVDHGDDDEYQRTKRERTRKHDNHAEQNDLLLVLIDNRVVELGFVFLDGDKCFDVVPVSALLRVLFVHLLNKTFLLVNTQLDLLVNDRR